MYTVDAFGPLWTQKNNATKIEWLVHFIRYQKKKGSSRRKGKGKTG